MISHVAPISLDVIKSATVARALTERRKLGAFYTPERLSRLLADWAIRSADDTVLEPSFGGCGFLTAARDVLLKRGCTKPSQQMYGCDVDPHAFVYLSSIFDGEEDTSGFVLRDFLDSDSVPGWPEQFTSVLANPPYIPHHRIGRARVRELSSRDWGAPSVGGRSSLWAYFIWQSIKHLAIDGRMAWVLPGAFLQADYALPIKNYLARRFDRVAAIVVRDRLFLAEGTDEETVVLLAEGHRLSDSFREIELGEAQTLDELENIVKQWQSFKWNGNIRGVPPAALSMSKKDISSFEKLRGHTSCVSFGALARVQIGIVTGANDFFVLSRDQISQLGFEKSDCNFVLPKFRAAQGSSLRSGDLERYSDEGGKVFLVTSKAAKPGGRVESYLATFDEVRRENISTFKKRSVWSETCDGRIPDAFFPVMHHTGPRLVLNELQCNCTNTIHRVFFDTSLLEERRKIATISFLTSFSQISAELVGRRYGSGVLKHEPRDAEKIQLLMPEMDASVAAATFEKIDTMLRSGDGEGALTIADEFIYGGCSIKNAQSLSKTLSEGKMGGHVIARACPARRGRRPGMRGRSLYGNLEVYGSAESLWAVGPRRE